MIIVKNKTKMYQEILIKRQLFLHYLLRLTFKKQEDIQFIFLFLSILGVQTLFFEFISVLLKKTSVGHTKNCLSFTIFLQCFFYYNIFVYYNI